MAEFVAAAAIADVPPGTVRAVTLGGRSILLCHDETGLYAIENLCSHAAEPLECGRMRRGWIACPAHGGRFDLETGEAIGPPAVDPIAVFPVRVAGGTIEVALTQE